LFFAARATAGINSPMMEDARDVQRSCEGCVACCDGSLRIKVFEHDVYPGKPCPFCADRGCAIYDRRPRDPCQQFICGWLARRSPLPDWMRPDRAGFVLLPAKLQWRGLRVDVAVPTGAGLRERALIWLKDFSRREQRPLLYQVGEDWYAFGPPEFQHEIKARIDRGETLWT
jgi:hypothetical protein